MTGEITRITEKLEEHTSFGINLQLEMEEYMFDSGLTAYTEGVNEPGIIKLEHSLLDVAGCPNLLNGLFYVTNVHKWSSLHQVYIYKIKKKIKN